MLQEVVRRMKATGGVGIQLDVSKAFDTLPHDAIRRALAKRGVPEPIIG